MKKYSKSIERRAGQPLIKNALSKQKMHVLKEESDTLYDSTHYIYKPI